MRLKPAFTETGGCLGVMLRLGLLAAFVAPLAHARLEFAETSIHLRAEIEQREARARFAFTNAGSTPVEITQIKTSCGCTTTKLEQTVYAPGETGAIEALFEFGGRVGTQQKQIMVMADGDVYRLRLRVDIPVMLEVHPRVLRWKRDAPPVPQTLEIRLADPENYAFVGVPEAVPGFALEVAAPEPGIRRLTLTPEATGGAVTQPLRIGYAPTDAADDESAAVGVERAFLLVR